MLMIVVLACLLAYGVEGSGFKSFLKGKNPPFETKVVGGSNAKIGEFPYQVSIQIRGGPYSQGHFCGGSIITPSTVLTAGHCVVGVRIDSDEHMEIRAGLVNVKNPGRDSQSRRIAKTIVHPDYKGGATPNDLAIHILDKPFVFNDYAKAVKLPTNGSIATGLGTLSGWGSTSPRPVPILPNHLQKIQLKIIPYQECKAEVDEIQPLNSLADTNMCTGSDGNMGACVGDSGGPLVTGTGDDRVLVGVVSWGYFPCGKKGRPSIYGNVADFLGFINENKV